MGFRDFPEDGGRGAVALRDIEVSIDGFPWPFNIKCLQEGHVLFTIPRSLTLSIRTSSLPKRLGDTWRKFELGDGWAGLILCVIWEEAQEAASKWSGYLGACRASIFNYCSSFHAM